MHKTVLQDEAIEMLHVGEGKIVVDATFGGGGHTQRILDVVGKNATVVVIDRDYEAYTRACELKQSFFNIHPVHDNYQNIKNILDTFSINHVDAILFDIGLSQYLLDQSGRGFSFRKDEPLDMRMDVRQRLTAKEIVSRYPEEELADLIFHYGEERRSRKIARAIVEHRKKTPIETSKQLARIVRSAFPQKAQYRRTDPATKTFQALRIAVNDELHALSTAVESALDMLSSGGRCVVITFHSLEDRIVKHLFRDAERNKGFVRITKKPLYASEDEVRENPRARSAKMRVIEKVCS